MKLYTVLLALFVVNASGSDFFKGKTAMEDPFALRDPFNQIEKEVRVISKKKYEETKKGSFTNLPGLGKFREIDLNELKVVGIVFGKKRRAFVRIGKDATNYVLKEGIMIGKNGAELKAILPNGIILVEKILNVYGEEEYLETVIAITR